MHAGVPAGVEAIILRALNRRPENRYQTAEELAVDLRRTAATLGNQEARAFAEDSDSTIVSMVTEFPTPARRLEWDMRPRELRDEGICRVLLQNNAPTHQTVTLAVETPRGGLYVDAAQKQISLVPGQQGVVDFYLQPMKRPFTGRKREWPFVVRATPISSPGSVSEMTGQVNVRPQIPLWLGLLILALMAVLCAMTVWVLTSVSLLEGILALFGL